MLHLWLAHHDVMKHHWMTRQPGDQLKGTFMGNLRATNRLGIFVFCGGILCELGLCVCVCVCVR